MRSIDFPQRNTVVAENQSEYLSLYAFAGQIGSVPGEKGFVMCFELSDEEIKNVVEYRRVWYSQLTFGNPMNPVSFFVCNNLFDPQDQQTAFIENLSLQKLEDVRSKWAAKTFPSATTQSALHHLKEEIKEVEADPTDVMEYADMLMLVMEAARLSGFSADDILKAFAQKHEINKSRIWVKNRNGSYYHLK